MKKIKIKRTFSYAGIAVSDAFLKNEATLKLEYFKENGCIDYYDNDISEFMQVLYYFAYKKFIENVLYFCDNEKKYTDVTFYDCNMHFDFIENETDRKLIRFVDSGRSIDVFIQLTENEEKNGSFWDLEIIASNKEYQFKEPIEFVKRKDINMIYRFSELNTLFKMIKKCDSDN